MPGLRHWRIWMSREPVLAGLSRSRILDVLAERRQDPAGADTVLAALARLARHDPTAGELLLAVLAPEITGLARRYARTLGFDEAFGIAVAAVWDRVARYDPPTSHIAYRLRWLAGRAVNRAARIQRESWARTRTLDPTGDDWAANDSRVGLPVAVLLRDGVRTGVLTTADAWLIGVTEVTGHSLRWAARQLGLDYETAKKRRQRAEDRLANSWAPATQPTRTDVGGAA